MNTIHFDYATSFQPEIVTDCLIVGIYENNELSSLATEIDHQSQGQLKNILQLGDMQGKLEQVVIIPQLSGTRYARIMCVGLGNQANFDGNQYRKACDISFKTLKNLNVSHVIFGLTQEPLKNMSAHEQIRYAVLASLKSQYTFTTFKSNNDNKTSHLEKIQLLTSPSLNPESLNQNIDIGKAIGNGINLARDLANTSANVCTPTYLAQTALELAKKNPLIKTEILDREQIKNENMNSFLAVTQGSHEQPKFIIMQYFGTDKASAPYVLIGKGITFDSGGISLKPGPAMDEMKFDMCGAASVLGTMQAIADLKLPINLICLIPTCENLPGGAAIKPGDIIKTRSGKTVEILNTDAEGRLILCDALDYAKKFNPKAVIDIATLTGAIIIALGTHFSGLFSHDDGLAEELIARSEATGDKLWRMPLWEEYQKKSRQ